MRKRTDQGKSKIRVMLVDDHAGMREALRITINSEPDLTVVAEADSGQSALELLPRTKPDVVLMDGSMPTMNGIEATRRLIELQPSVRIIGLTLYQEATYLEEMLAAGARACVSKTGDPANVTKTIRAIAAGESYFHKSVTRRSSTVAQVPAVNEELSADQLAVVKRLANGRTNAEIAAELDLTISAVEAHRTAAMKKLKLRSRAELARVAATRHWLDAW
jgi:DNA-binding NarL/FixJ family response regulator